MVVNFSWQAIQRREIKNTLKNLEGYMNKKTLALLCIVLIVVGIAWLVLSYVRYLPQWDYGQGGGMMGGGMMGQGGGMWIIQMEVWSAQSREIAKIYLAAKNNPYPEKVSHLRVSFTVTRVAKLTVNG